MSGNNKKELKGNEQNTIKDSIRDSAESRLKTADIIPFYSYKASLYLETARKMAKGKTSYIPSESEKNWAKTILMVEFTIGMAIIGSGILVTNKLTKMLGGEIHKPKYFLLVPLILGSGVGYFSLQPRILDNFYTTTNSPIAKTLYTRLRETDPARTRINKVMEENKSCSTIDLSNVDMGKKNL